MDVRVIGWLSLGVVVGFALGGFGPRRELHALAQENTALREQLERVDRPNPLAMFLPQLGSENGRSAPTRSAAIPSPPAAPEPQRDAGAHGGGEPRKPGGSVAVIGGDRGEPWQARRRPERAPDRPRDPGGPARATTSAGPDEDTEGDGRQGRRRPRLSDFDRIASLQRARLAASRTALISQAGLDEQQVAEVDQTVTKMNDRLVGYGEEVITQMAAEEPPSPAQTLGIGHDVSGVLFEGQQELDRIVGGAREQVEPEAIEIWNYVDVEQWRPFVDQKLAEGAGGTASEGLPPAPAGPASGKGGSGP